LHATLSLAERALGLHLISSSDGKITFLFNGVQERLTVHDNESADRAVFILNLSIDILEFFLLDMLSSVSEFISTSLKRSFMILSSSE
jgi:hypothetical protein